MTKEETIMCIKDSIFESVMMGNPIIVTLRNLHFVDGYEKEDVIQAFNEMKEEAND